jgi:UDP-glucose 6-dehydrogenase
MDNTLSVIGLGKLGSAMLASFAHKGWDVFGVDINQNFVDKINGGIAPVYEPQVTELLQKNIDHIVATTDLRYAILNSMATFIIVPTPSLESGRFSIEYVEKVIRGMAPAIREKNGYHLVVITSTVLPGDSVHLRELLEALSGKISGIDFGFCYNPDFIALGKIVHDFLNPDMILIGQDDETAGEILEKIHLSIVDNSPTIHRMSLYNAELAKIGLNSYCTLKITYANVIAEICENMPTGDASVVLNAIGADSRVGNKYFRGGLGFSGPCVRPETLIRTDKGLRRIDQLKIGDTVLTHMGRYKEITKVYIRLYDGPMVKIISMGSPSIPIVTTPDHPIWVASVGKNEPQFTPAYKIENADSILMPVFIPIPEGSNLTWCDGSAIGFNVESVSEEQYKGQVYNLEVEEDNSYVLEWGTVHNCFPRDNRALINVAGHMGVYHLLSDRVDEINNYHKTSRLSNLFLDILHKKDVESIAILGISYKEETPVIEESTSIAVAKRLAKEGIVVTMYDPQAMSNAKVELTDIENARFADSIEECLKDQSVCFIATPWNQFKLITADQLKQWMRSDPLILDAWNILPDMDGIDVRRIGKNNR